MEEIIIIIEALESISAVVDEIKESQNNVTSEELIEILTEINANQKETINLFTSIDIRLGQIYAILLITIIIKFLWTMFDKWFFGQ